VTQRGMTPFPVPDLERGSPQLVEATSVFLHKLTYDIPLEVYSDKAYIDQLVVVFRNEGRGWTLSVTARGWTSYYHRKRRSDIVTGRHLLSQKAPEVVELALQEVGLLKDDILNPDEDGRQWQEPEPE